MIKFFLCCTVLALLPLAASGQQNHAVVPQGQNIRQTDQPRHDSQTTAKRTEPNQMPPVQQPSAAMFEAPVSGEAFSGASAGPDEVVVMPEITQAVEFSNTAFNRIYCADVIQDAFASEEKLLDVRWTEHNAFIKFLYLVKDGKPQYALKPMEISIVCGGEIYTLIAVPKPLPSSPKIRLSSGKKKQIHENASIFSGLDLEKKERRFVEFAYKDNIPASFDRAYPNITYKIFKDMEISLMRIVTATGEGLRLKEFRLLNGTADTLRLTEKMFLQTELTSMPVFITLSKLNLKSGDNARLFIVERTGGGSEQDRR
jgi:hypothetical protein